MNEPATRTGGCACRAVRYRVEGTPDWVAHCHCSDCRRTSGTAVSTYAGYPTDRFAFIVGDPTTFPSSPGVARRFCGRCGTPLTFQSERWPGEIHLLVGTLDDPAALAPQMHIYVAEQIPWLHIADGLPRYRTIPSLDGGPVE